MRSTRKTSAERWLASRPPWLGLALLSLAVGLGACKEEASAPPYAEAGNAEPRRGGVLRFSIIDTVRTLDPAIAYDEFSIYCMHYMHDTLIGYGVARDENTGTELVPQLAESWRLSADTHTYSFTIRAGARFADGRPVVAGDFKYSLERVLRKQDSPFAQFIMGVVGAADLRAGTAQEARGIRVLDDRHLEIELIAPDAAFPFVLAMKFAAPLKRDVIEGMTDAEVRRLGSGTGPFVLDSWTEGDRLVFRRNEGYWEPGVPYLDELVMYEAISRDTAFLKFQAGELDTVDRLSSPDFIYMARQPAWQPYLFNAARMNVYGEKMNCRMKPFTDKRVRQAMNYALDKEHTIKLINGRGVVSHGALPPQMPGFDASLKPYPHDPARARQLLAEAGYPNGFSIKYVTLHDDQSEKLAQAMQADLAEVGIDMEIELMSFPTYLQASGKPGLPFSYTAWLMDYPDPSNFLDVKFHSRMIAAENSNNDSFYSNPKLDAKLDAAKRELDPDKRWAMYRDIERLLYDEAPWIWNYHQNFVEVRQPYVKGYFPHPVWVRDYNRTWLDLGPNGERVKR